MKITDPQIADLIEVLKTQSPASLRMLLPDGDAVPSHFHVTEVGRVQKDFIDCGGTVRQLAHCQLQLLVATDFEHRLPPEKLLKIIEMSLKVLGDSPLPLTVEYGQKAAVIYQVSELDVTEERVLRFHLKSPQTACLSPDTCGLSYEEAGRPNLEVKVCLPNSGCC